MVQEDGFITIKFVRDEIYNMIQSYHPPDAPCMSKLQVITDIVSGMP